MTIMTDIRCGTDIIEISRIKKSLENPRFVSRVFSARELNQYNGRLPADSLAAAFCAKEAFSKAIGTGVRGFGLNEVELLHNSEGKPYLTFSGDARKLVDKDGLSFDVSLSHTKELATACVIAWRDINDGCDR